MVLDLFLRLRSVYSSLGLGIDIDTATETEKISVFDSVLKLRILYYTMKYKWQKNHLEITTRALDKIRNPNSQIYKTLTEESGNAAPNYPEKRQDNS